jgi:hypothetical protein
MAEPFRPNLFQHATAHKSSEQPSVSSKKSHLHSLHHHTHRHHHTHSSRHRAKDAVQSAIPLHPPTSFGDLLRQARVKGSNSTTPSESRRGSVQDPTADGTPEDAIERDRQRESRKSVRPADVEKERRRAKAREEYVKILCRPSFAVLTWHIENYALRYRHCPINP